MNELRTKYNAAVEGYCEAFATKQGLAFSTYNKFQGVASFGGHYFELKDVLFDIDTNQPSGRAMAWQEEVDGGLSISYPAYCRGVGPMV